MPEITMLEGIRQALFEEMERDPAVVAIGEDIGVYGGAFKATEGLLARFGHQRVIETPISETAIVGAACGMSYMGLRPVAEMQFADFIACAFDQIVNQAATLRYRYGGRASVPIEEPLIGETCMYKSGGNFILCQQLGERLAIISGAKKKQSAATLARFLH